MSSYRSASSYNDNSATIAVLLLVLSAAYLVGFYFFHKAGIARPYPTTYNNFLWGFLQGMYAVPSFILSLFNPEHYAIYQTPNIGDWYNFGFLIGVGGFAKSFRVI